jgi:hypothetical protein
MFSTFELYALAQAFRIAGPSDGSLDYADAIGTESLSHQTPAGGGVKLGEAERDVLFADGASPFGEAIRECADGGAKNELQAIGQVGNEPQHSQAKPRWPVTRAKELAQRR